MSGIGRIALADGAPAARMAIDASATGAVEIAMPAIDDLPYRDFVRAILRRGGFKLDFNRLEPDAALAMVSDQLLGPGAFIGERAALAADIARLAEFAGALVGARASVSIRTYFAPGDTVWHVDRVNEAAAYRLLWPIARPAGMLVIPAHAIDITLHQAFMRREHALLGHLDTRVLRTGATAEDLWAHRPRQLAAMASGSFPFVRDSSAVQHVTAGAASIHRVQTPQRPGTFHRSSWANRDAPGLQVVITAAADPA